MCVSYNTNRLGSLLEGTHVLFIQLGADKCIILVITDELAPRFPSSVAETTITSSTANIRWMLTDPYNPSRPETFMVSYGITAGQLNISTPGVTANPTSQAYSTQLNSLEPATAYFYRLKSVNRFDTLISHELSFITKDDSKFISM